MDNLDHDASSDSRKIEEAATERSAKNFSKEDRFAELLWATRADFEASLRQHVPASAYRDFHLWAVSTENSQWQDYAQTMGLTQLARLTMTLLAGLVEDRDWPRLLLYSGALNAYLTYEAVSDNLAIGLANRSESDVTYEKRRSLLSAFNQAMIDRLAGDPRSAAELLQPVQPIARQISNFSYSLNRKKWKVYAEGYLSQQGQLALDDLEYDTGMVLVANIEACVAMTQTLSRCQLGALLRAGLINRYWAVNRLLESKDMTLTQLADLGADAILVMPTLAYYIIVLAEILQPVIALHRVIADGLLAQALYDAALLVRLLNDLGTSLLVQTVDERAVLLAELAKRYQEKRATQTIQDVLLAADGQCRLLTRLHKDIAFGEFNLSLYGLTNFSNVPEALSVFGRNLNYFSDLYKERWGVLQARLAIITERLNDERVSILIDRFVRFHEQLYRNPYDTREGEYAIAI